MTFDNAKTAILLAGVGFIVWKVYRADRAVSNAVDSVDSARVTIGKGIGGFAYDLFNTKPVVPR